MSGVLRQPVSPLLRNRGGAPFRPPVPGCTEDISRTATGAAATEELDQSCSEGDLRSFHGRLVPLLNEQARRQHAHRYLFTRSALDLAEGGHRQLLVERATCLAEYCGYQHSEASLFPASHYFVRARPDYRTAAVLQEFIDRAGPLRSDSSSRADVLEEAAREKLVEAVLEAEPASVVHAGEEGEEPCPHAACSSAVR